jgi:hypothetical protein
MVKVDAFDYLIRKPIEISAPVETDDVQSPGSRQMLLLH